MEELAIYLLKSTAVLAVFVLIYHFLLRRLTFFQANRFFLLFGLFASIVFPLVEITQTVYVEQPLIVAYEMPAMYTPTAAIATTQIETEPILLEKSVDFTTLSYVLYAMLALFFLGKMSLELSSLYNLISSGEISRRGRFLLVSLSRKLTPFSFFHYICFTDNDEKTPEFELIFNHEKVHASQWHSLDVLLSTLYRAVFWFNPLAWWVKRQITENLEFIADSEAKAANTSSISYERTLLSVMASQHQPALANNFFTPFIKKRIIMLQKETSARWNAYKYALILPVIVLFLYSFNVVEKIEYLKTDSTKSIIETESEFVPKFYQVTKETTDAELEFIKDEINTSKKYLVKSLELIRNSEGALNKLKVNLLYNDRDDGNHNFSVGTDDIVYESFEINAQPDYFEIGITGTDFYMKATEDGVKFRPSEKYGIDQDKLDNLAEELIDSNIYQITPSSTDAEINKIVTTISEKADRTITVQQIDRKSDGTIKMIKFAAKVGDSQQNPHTFSFEKEQGVLEDIIIVEADDKLTLKIVGELAYVIDKDGFHLESGNKGKNSYKFSNEQGYFGSNPLLVFDDQMILKNQIPAGTTITASEVVMLYSKEAVQKYGDRASNGALVYKGAKLADFLPQSVLKNGNDEILILKITSATTIEQLEEKVERLKEYDVDMVIEKTKFKKGKLVRLKFSLDDNDGYSTTQDYNTTDGINTVCINRTKKNGITQWSIDSCAVAQAYFLTDDVIKDAMISIRDAKLEEKLAKVQQKLTQMSVDSLIIELAAKKDFTDGLSDSLNQALNISSQKLKKTLEKLKTLDSQENVSINKIIVQGDTIFSIKDIEQDGKVKKDTINQRLKQSQNRWSFEVGINKVSVLDSTLYVVDGKIISQAEGMRLNPDRIFSVYVLSKDEAIAKYGNKAKNGAAVIQLNDKDLPKFVDQNYSRTGKPMFNIVAPYSAYKDSVYLNANQPKYASGGVITGGYEPLIIVNGKKYDDLVMGHLTSNKIKSVSVFKGEEATRLYGADAKRGVVIVEYDGLIDMDNLPELGTEDRPISLYIAGDVNPGEKESNVLNVDFLKNFNRKMLEDYAEKIKESGYNLNIRTFKERRGKVVKLKVDFAGSTYTVETNTGIKELTFDYYKDGRKPVMTSRSY
ncbi:MAG: M56 family metallopeptidase [Nonlabens sp.]